MPPSVADIAPHRLASIETRASWVVAWTALAIYSVSFGAPAITVVALKPIAADLGGARSVPALAYSLAWFGAAVGGIAMGWIAERFGVRCDGDVRRGDDRAPGWRSRRIGGRLALYGRPRRADRPPRQCRHQCAALRLCRALVRPPARHGAGADLVGPVSSPATVWPTDLRARHRGAFGWRNTMLAYAVFEIVA